LVGITDDLDMSLDERKVIILFKKHQLNETLAAVLEGVMVTKYYSMQFVSMLDVINWFHRMYMLLVVRHIRTFDQRMVE
jgi:hypothetical protein